MVEGSADSRLGRIQHVIVTVAARVVKLDVRQQRDATTERFEQVGADGAVHERVREGASCARKRDRHERSLESAACDIRRG
eukprot:1554911-Prymnesium_polylepis.1